MRKPNFFIIGAPKCGTTALHYYLSEHPQVFMSDPKEPYFWCTDLPGHGKVNTLQEYLNLFADATDEHQAVGEATPFYLFSDAAPKLIHEFRPDAKLIAMFRNPVDQAHAMHRQLCFGGHEDVTDFEAAWRLQKVRSRGERICRTCQDPEMLQYREVASFGRQVRRWLDVFPRKQIRFYLLEDLARSARDVYVDALEFLGVPDDGRTDFPPVNVSHVNLLPRLGRWLHHPPKALLKVNNTVKRVLGLRETRVRNLLLVKRKRPPLPEDFRRELTEVFSEDVELLESLIGRDLSHWRRVEVAQ